MNIFFSTLILPILNTCILRKQKHCITYNVIKNRSFPVFTDEAVIESHDSQTLKRSFHDEIKDISTYEPENKRTKTDDSHDFNLDKNLEVKPVNKHGNIDKLSNMSIDRKLNKIYNIYLIYCKNEQEEFKNKYVRFLSGDIEGMYELLEFYLKKNIRGRQMTHYMLRIDNIKRKYKNFILDEILSLKASAIFKLYKTNLISLLKVMISDDWLEVQPLDVDVNLGSYRDLIRKNNLFLLLNYLNCIEKNTLEFYFNYELFKCIRHSYKVPVVMMLNLSYYKHNYAYLTFTIHLIRLLIENFSSDKKADKLLFFLIYLALKFSNKRSLDIFALKNIKTFCLNRSGKIHEQNFYYLAWELGRANRRHLKKTLDSQKYLTKDDYTHNKHFIFIDLMYLYQQVVFLKCKNGNDYKIDKKFITLFDDLFTRNNKCFACGFEKLTEISKEQYTSKKIQGSNDSALT